MRGALFVAALTLSGCALLSKSEPTRPRYFDLGEFAVPSTGTATSTVRLGAISSAADLRTYLVERTGPHEVRYAEDLRWTERPEVYLRRALTRALFQSGAFREARAGAGLSLDVELLAFEWSPLAPSHVRVQLAAKLRDERQVRATRTFNADVALAPKAEPDAVVAALARALEAVTLDLLGWVRASF